MVLFWLAVAAYLYASVSYAIAASFKRTGFVRYGTLATAVGLLLHSAMLIARWIRVEHGPYINKFEVWVSDAWVIVAVFLVAQLVYPRIRAAGLLVAPVGLLLMGGAVTMPQTKDYFPPTFESLWLVVHITFAKLAFGSLVLASALAALYLLKRRVEEGHSSATFYDRLPPIGVVDDLIYRFTLFGFFMLAIMIVAGALWANKSWGRYWGWDPIETWSLLVWVVYGIYLHLRRTLGWKGQRAAVFSLFAVSFVLISYFVIPYLPGTIHELWQGK
ncbi:MAG: cytochrome c biogenesis protein CcsA [Actinobacteria bacterium]|nr:cytochrome c biogenesis protein CcsA [Actinomycetota bacterium]